MPRCQAKTRDGTPCERIVSASHAFCFAHDPSKAEARSRNAAAGGRGKASKEVRTLKAEIKGVIADVKSGDLDRNDAGVMVSGYRALKDFIELERRVAEQDQLLARLERLEAEQGAQNGGRVTWG